MRVRGIRGKRKKIRDDTRTWIVLLFLMITAISLPVVLSQPTLSQPIIKVDHPPDPIMYTKTGNHKVLVTAIAKDDVDLSSLTITVNDKPVLSIEKKGSTFVIRLRHKLSENQKEYHVPVKKGEFYKGMHYKDIQESNLRKQLDVISYPIILQPGSYTIKFIAKDSAGQTAEKEVVVTIKRDYPPTISITAPSSVRTNTQTAKVKANIQASDDLGLRNIKLFVDNKYIQTINTNNQKSYSGSVILDITGIGQHTITATVTDTGGESRSASARVQLIQNKPPSVKIVKIENTITTKTTANVKFTISYSDNTGIVSKVDLYVDNRKVDEIKPNKASGSWVKSVTLSVGSHTAKVVATDDMGLQSSAITQFQVERDYPPHVKITEPKNGQIFWTTGSNTRVTIKATATDDYGLKSVDYYVDNRHVGSGSSVTVTLGIGQHTIKAVATDIRGQTASDTVSITVRKDNPPSVSITSPKNGQIFWTTGNSVRITVKASASDDRVVTKVEFYVDGRKVVEDTSAPYEAVGTLGIGTHTISVIAYDNAGQKNSASIKVTVRKDNPPSVSITNPRNGQVFWTTRGRVTITISANANDDRKVTKVEFYVDNKLLSTDTTSPYSARATLGIGSHTITVTAYDNAGQKRSASVRITVKKDNPPHVSITSPRNGQVFWTTGKSVKITIRASASDDRKVTRVDFYIDGKKVSIDTTNPYTTSATLTIGQHAIKAVAYDNAGQSSTNTVSITVKKDNPPAVSFSVSDGGDV